MIIFPVICSFIVVILFALLTTEVIMHIVADFTLRSNNITKQDINIEVHDENE